MAGFDMKLTTTKAKSSGTEWGIHLDGFWSPGPVLPDDITSYTWNIYLLPANKRWTKEILQHVDDAELRNRVDPNSAPWRIVYEVVQFTTLSERR